MKQVTDSEGIGKLWASLKQLQLELDAEEIADLLYLAVQIGGVNKTSATTKPVEKTQTKTTTTEAEETQLPATPPPAIPEPAQPAASVNLPSSSDDTQSQSASDSIPFKTPAAPGLRNQLALARALRPLMRKVSSRTKKILDEEETVTQFAENRILIPVFKPEPERWLDLALVVEKSSSVVIWQEIIAEFQKLIELSGAFRSVSTWSLQTDEKGEIKLFAQQNKSASKQRSRSPKELLDSAGRRLILLVSDCTSDIWYQDNIYQILKLWSNSGLLAIVQLFPEKLWTRTVMGFGYPVLLNALEPGVPNKKLKVEELPVWEEVDVNKGIALPVITLDPDSVKQWSRVVVGVGSTQTAGILFDPNEIPKQRDISPKDTSNNNKLSAKDLVNRFRATASPTARRLAGLMATVPVSLPVIHLIQQTLLKESMQVHVAEVFMSGLLKPQLPTDKANTVIATQGSNPKHLASLNYDFVEGVRDLLIDSVPTPDVDEVLHEVSQYIASKAGISIKNFAALLSPDTEWDEKTKQDIDIKSFAKITTDTLYRLGGEYAAFAEDLKLKPSNAKTQPSPETPEDFPPLENFDFEIANIVIQEPQKILILAANPKDTSKLRLDEEVREIEAGLERAKNRDQFILEDKLAVRPRDIYRAMLDLNPQIVHFSGHGSGDEGLIFEDETGQTKLVDGEALAGLFALFPEVECVVLNGCYSEVQASAIAQHVNYVIGMKKAIGDRAAIEFAVSFYDALGSGRPVEFAYKLGCAAIRLAGIEEHLTPVLLKKSDTSSAIAIQPFEFEVATIELKKTGFFGRKTELVINRRRQQANGFSEYLENQGDETALEMVQIPGGTFTMGAPETEEGSKDDERPQHQVTVPDFFMGKYPVTQAQWKFVASLPQVNRELKADPSYSKGDNRPVERVSWFDAVEYCQRLSQHTKRNYRLPSEAEWEYACRAGTTTPFHFGETITSELANYDAEYTYGVGTKGTSRGETTEVGSFGIANGFGLYDMHGNVWEWCADEYHDNYEGATTDGSAWIDESDNDNRSRLLRGGSWLNDPGNCRSAYRYDSNPDIDSSAFGFRVVCGVRGLL
ncbi:SAV_2336 N-terminal domain-related protein [Rivularia sp. UHCC 0363]|uniref:SAV_2336 N-terminal domain-related protein n=1 Tax=Rivularia sp. UHCC 0363 TaxID=3110244 RepID=UPI002B21E244|nr:SAV_2336 N-terminal domain-related protein [Rivularia sp. UHCC 0363]MEA5593328.1 SAV_2336 N-terminal domain-related protein [Rivularia sp. UHCC 0363]